MTELAIADHPHAWYLHLDPDVPSWVIVRCATCQASLNDVWAGATDLIHMQMGDFTVADGQHTATRVISMPIDVRIKESVSFSSASGLSTTLSVFVTPNTPGIEQSPGWCAPSP